MNEFRQKVSISDKDFVIHILNNLPEGYDVILNGLENHPMVTGDDVLIIDVICEKLNDWKKKLKTKKKKNLRS